MRIINVSAESFEWPFDGVMTVIAPGQVLDVPANVAANAIKRGWVLDEFGEPVRQRVRYLSEVSSDPAVMAMVTFPCPFSGMGTCSKGPFKDVDALRMHLEEHAGKPRRQ